MERIAVDALPISVGVSGAHRIPAPQVSSTGDAGGDRATSDDEGGSDDEPRMPARVIDIGAALTGALFGIDYEGRIPRQQRLS